MKRELLKMVGASIPAVAWACYCTAHKGGRERIALGNETFFLCVVMIYVYWWDAMTSNLSWERMKNNLAEVRWSGVLLTLAAWVGFLLAIRVLTMELRVTG